MNLYIIQEYLLSFRLMTFHVSFISMKSDHPIDHCRAKVIFSVEYINVLDEIWGNPKNIFCNNWYPIQ